MKQKSINLRFVVKQNTKKGSYTLEAAIFLPLFIVGILTLGFTVRMISTGENITFAAVDEARLASKYAYNIPVAPLFSNRLESRIIDENVSASSIRVTGFHYLYNSDENDGLISFRLNYWLDPGLPLGMTDGIGMTQQYRCRGFIGRSADGTPVSFDEMETVAAASMVWVFPEGGKRYHTRSCTFVASYPAQMILNQELRNKYAPCEKCETESIENGTQVYCFQEYGESYHRLSCPTIDKYIIAIEKNQAEARGYTPCLKCGGNK
jgi:hypothetical protein